MKEQGKYLGQIIDEHINDVIIEIINQSEQTLDVHIQIGMKNTNVVKDFRFELFGNNSKTIKFGTPQLNDFLQTYCNNLSAGSAEEKPYPVSITVCTPQNKWTSMGAVETGQCLYLSDRNGNLEILREDSQNQIRP